MLLFDPNDPFPHLVAGAASYADAQKHSEQVDAWLGFDLSLEARINQRENALGQNLWIGLPRQALLTPYTEIREILELIEPQAGQTVVDLGAAYGRMAFVMARHFPDSFFVGYEYVSERVADGKKLIDQHQLTNSQLLQADLAQADFTPAVADFYFLYDYGSRDAIEKTLQDLRTISLTRGICVVGRGRASRDAIERHHPWLSQVVEPEHYSHFSIYRSRISSCL